MEQKRTLHYREPVPIARDEVERAFATGDTGFISEAMVNVAFHEPDWQWAQAQALWCARQSDDDWVRYIGVLCLGHIVRIHGRLDLDEALPLLLELRADSETSSLVREYVESTLWDINVYADSADLRRAGWVRLVKGIGWWYNRSARRWEPPVSTDDEGDQS